MTVYTDLFDSITDDVLALTKRPDLADETAIAVRTATLNVHMAEAFPRDAVTQLVKIPNASYITQLDAQVLFPRIRGLSTVRITDTDYNPVEFPEIDIVEMGDLRDPIYKELKNDIAYLAGTAVNIRTSVPTTGYLVEYFQLPLIRREQYNSWIAQLAPDAIVYLAASIVFYTNGNEEKARAFDSFYQKTLLPGLRANFLTTAQR